MQSNSNPQFQSTSQVNETHECMVNSVIFKSLYYNTHVNIPIKPIYIVICLKTNSKSMSGRLKAKLFLKQLEKFGIYPLKNDEDHELSKNTNINNKGNTLGNGRVLPVKKEELNKSSPENKIKTVSLIDRLKKVHSLIRTEKHSNNE